MINGSMRVANAVIDFAAALLELVALAAIVARYEETHGESYELELGIDDEYDFV